MPIVTFVVPILRGDFIKPCLESLYKYTPIDFRVIVIDNNNLDEAEKACRGLYHLWIKSYRNLGFSKSMNTGILLSQTPYVALMNDDLVFMDERWWQGIVDTFKMDEKIIAVNPNSPKEGSWGYGLTSENKDTWKPREGFTVCENDIEHVVPIKPDGTSFEYKDKFTKEDYDFLLNNHPIWTKDTLCDAIAMWCTVFKREGLQKVGLLDERFYPGGGEDYCMNCEAYSQGLRMVGTTKSWVYHHWGRSKDAISGKDPTNKMFESRPRWNANEEIWGDNFDVWGYENLPDGSKRPLKRLLPKFIDDL